MNDLVSKQSFLLGQIFAKVCMMQATADVVVRQEILDDLCIFMSEELSTLYYSDHEETRRD